LDDRAGVQRAAMKSLVQIAGHDVGNSAGTDSGSPADQVRRWKQWYASSKSP
jgi:hypothetical protein